jgi:zinc and cadmium transporter
MLMPPTGILLFSYCLLVLLASVMGGQLQNLVRMTHLRTQLLMSGVGGLMLGIALLHLLPHGSEILGSSSKVGTGALIGLIVMFLLIRLFHTHDHGVPVEADSMESSRCSHGHDHSHDHDHAAKGISWAGLFFGLALHTLVDGVALASSVLADAHHGAWLGLAGLGTFLAVALHKPLDAFAITSVMNKQRWSHQAQNAANIAFSLACPVGAGMFYFSATTLTDSPAALGWGLAISAGFFIGIALADLLPEVAFHDHDRGKLTLALLLGVAIAVGIENLPGHNHAFHDHGAHGKISEQSAHGGVSEQDASH